MTVVTDDLAACVAEHVADGDCVWLGNFGSQLFAVGEELIRRRRRDLHVVAGSGGILLDQLIGAGVVGEVTFAHCWSAVGPHPAWRFRRTWESGSGVGGPRFHEVSLGLLNAALGAAAAGVPFAAVDVPAPTGYATDDWSAGMLDEVQTRFGAATVVRALAPDVAFVHATLADRWGNAAVGTPLGDTLVAAQAARRVVVVAEELATTQAVVAAHVDLPGVLVDAVALAPGAVAPDGVPGRYERDVEAYAAYARAAREEATFERWLREVGVGAGVGAGAARP
jgi:glutaconate CoA-transferase subunit A